MWVLNKKTEKDGLFFLIGLCCGSAPVVPCEANYNLFLADEIASYSRASQWRSTNQASFNCHRFHLFSLGVIELKPSFFFLFFLELSKLSDNFALLENVWPAAGLINTGHCSVGPQHLNKIDLYYCYSPFLEAQHRISFLKNTCGMTNYFLPSLWAKLIFWLFKNDI